MNRRHFLALLGSTAVAPVLPAIAALALPSRGYDLMDLLFPADDANWGISPEQAALDEQWRDAVRYGTGVRWVDHIPFEEFLAPDVPGRPMPLAEVQRIAKRLRALAEPFPEVRMFTEEAA